MTPYEILGVPENATPEEIKLAWRRKAMAYHPDRGGDPKLFKEALHAYEALQKKSRWSASADAQSPRAPSAADFERYANAYYDAWLNVPSDVRFWLNTFETIHSATLFVAGPFLVGGSVAFLGGVLNGRGGQTLVGFIMACVCGFLIATCQE